MTLSNPDLNRNKEEKIPLSPAEKQIQQSYEFAFNVNNFNTAAYEALKLGIAHPEFLIEAEKCAAHLYHDQNRYFDSAKVYENIAESYLNLHNREKYEENMQYAATCYIEAANNVNEEKQGKEIANKQRLDYYQNAYEIYETLKSTDLLDFISKKINKLNGDINARK